MNASAKQREDIKKNIGAIAVEVNRVLNGGECLSPIESNLQRLGRGGQAPHWFDDLQKKGTLPNLDGKSLGSVIEMLFVAVLEKRLAGTDFAELSINPARGIDIPALHLGVKSPSENYCTSEPFFSAYDRLIGNAYDSVVLLTNYQTAKRNPPLKIQLIKATYLEGSQIADRNLCRIAEGLRKVLMPEKETELKKLIRFLAYINQSDLEANKLLKVIRGGLHDCSSIEKKLKLVIGELEREDKKREVANKEPRLETLIAKFRGMQPDFISIVNAADNWVVENWSEFARCPNCNEWERFTRSPLNGAITMSYALQWRYNFRNVFQKIDKL